MLYGSAKKAWLDKTAKQRDRTQARVERHMRNWGIAPGHDVVATMARSHDPMLVLQRQKHGDGLMRNVAFDKDGRMGVEAEQAIAEVTTLEIRRILRLRSLTAAGHTELDAPDWSVAAYPLLLAILRGHGIDPARHPRGARSLNERVEAAGLEWEGTLVQHGLIRFGSIRPKTGGWALEDWRTLSLRIDVPLPQTMVAMLMSTPGLRLGQVVDLPFDLPDVPVRRVTQEASGSVRVHLDRRVRSCAPVPDGIDRSWLRVPVMPVDDIPF